jgi:NAD(P)-dependent dehydrogenase (short-subunit alcohol dehydrogenase family)
VLVTGASSGIGRACALHLASLGASVAIHYHSSRAGAEETLRGVSAAAAAAAAAAGPAPPAAAPATAILLQADLSGARPGAAEALLQAALAGLGGLDVLVLSAGVYEEQAPGLGDAPSAFAAQFSRILHTNLVSCAELLHAAARHFAARRAASPASGGGGGGGSAQAQGAVVAIGSRGALRGEPAAWAYGASKAGLHALLQSAAVALGPLGVACGVVAPGWVETPMAAAALAGPGGAAVRAQSSWGRVAAPEEVARAVEFLGRFWETAFCTGALVDVNGASYLHT